MPLRGEKRKQGELSTVIFGNSFSYGYHEKKEQIL